MPTRCGRLLVEANAGADRRGAGEKRPDGAEVLPPVDLQEIRAVFYRKRTETSFAVLLAHCTHIICRTDHDLALLKANPDSPLPGGFPTIELAEPEEVEEGDEVGTCGFPLGEHLRDGLGTVTSSFTKGIVSSIIPGPGVPRHLLKGFQLDLGATGGNSGGPVFLWESGRVFGVLQSGIKHLVKAVSAHHTLDSHTLHALRDARVGVYPAVKA